MERRMFKSGKILMACAALLFAAYSQAGVPSAQAAQLKRVPTEKVCMINNEFMSKKLIPVEVDGKTYYGCCQACYSMLKNDAKARRAVDPVSGKQVDKATAVIGSLPNGKVFYFENESSFTSYQKAHGS